ncbi:MAG: hypothetical protein ABWK05_05830 [Pyrobaculum sp.]
MLGFLYLVLNATALAVPITSIPFVYTAPLGGCVNFSAYLDPLSPWGIASVYVVSNTGQLDWPQLKPYPTPKFIQGVACGNFLSIRVDKWMGVGPLVPVSVSGQDSAFLYGEIPVGINKTAVVKIKSFTKPQVAGDFVYKTYSSVVEGVYVEEYVVYGRAQFAAYGIANITYINLSDARPDYYVYIPTPGVKVEGVRDWAPDLTLWFGPNQSAVVGKPRLVVEQISIPVVGECPGVAYVVNPVQRPLTVYVKLYTGEEYTLSFYYIPANISTWRFQKAVATTLDGAELPVYGVETDEGYPVGTCLVQGLHYYVVVRLNGTSYRYAASVNAGVLEARTDIVEPRVEVSPPFRAVVSPPAARTGDNVTIRLYVNDTLVAKVERKAAPLIKLNTTAYFKTIRVVDVLGTPVDSFVVYVDKLKFYGTRGEALVVPVSDVAAVEVRGAKYLVKLSSEVRVPTLTTASFLKIAAAAATVGGVAASLFRKRRVEKEAGGADVVEV